MCSWCRGSEAMLRNLEAEVQRVIQHTDYDNFSEEQNGKAFEDKIAADYPDVVPPYPGNE